VEPTPIKSDWLWFSEHTAETSERGVFVRWASDHVAPRHLAPVIELLTGGTLRRNLPARGPSRPCLKNSCPQCRRRRTNPNRREWPWADSDERVPTKMQMAPPANAVQSHFNL